jgi:hypothetical protein
VAIAERRGADDLVDDGELAGGSRRHARLKRETRGKNHSDRRVRPRAMGEQRGELVGKAPPRPPLVLPERSGSTTNNGAPSDGAVERQTFNNNLLKE